MIYQAIDIPGQYAIYKKHGTKIAYYPSRIFDNELIQNEKCQIIGNTCLHRSKQGQEAAELCIHKKMFTISKKRGKHTKLLGYIKVSKSENLYLRLYKQNMFFGVRAVVVIAIFIFLISYILLKADLDKISKDILPPRHQLESQLIKTEDFFQLDVAPYAKLHRKILVLALCNNRKNTVDCMVTLLLKDTEAYQVRLKPGESIGKMRLSAVPKKPPDTIKVKYTLLLKDHALGTYYINIPIQ